MTVESAFEFGLRDHIALCASAGRPTVIPMKNGLARGVRQALNRFSDGSAIDGRGEREARLQNLQVRDAWWS